MMARSSSLKANFAGLVFKLARMRVLRPLVYFFFSHMNNFLPVERLSENEYWVAFHHPQPAHPLHILMMPRRNIENLMDAPGSSPELFSALFTMVQSLITEFKLEHYGYRLITNGGPYQSIPQWHWHLISELNGEPDA
jgi:histidine triad (HIT) family protein